MCVHSDSTDVGLKVLIIFQKSNFLATKPEVNKSMVVSALISQR